jgi:hypothetical protein
MSDSRSFQDLFADKGNVLGTGSVVVQVPRGGTEGEVASDSPGVGTIHHVSSLTYVDRAGHIHAVLIDEVTTAGGTELSTTIEILSDVVITPPPG